MKIQDINEIDDLLFSYEYIAQKLGIKNESAKVLCSRYVKLGYLLRIKRGVYMRRERWQFLSNNELLQIANIIQVPSYISLTTALSYYDFTTQVQQNFVESIAVKRSLIKTVQKVDFRYFKIAQQYYNGFIKQNGIFIAAPEKALADALYLTSVGKYKLDFSALEYGKIDYPRLNQILRAYPEGTTKLWSNYARTQAA